MKTSENFNIELLATYREDSRLEVKSAKGGLPNSLWESYSAFANSEGGVIVLGVKENPDGSFFVEGLKDAHKLLKDFWNMVNNRQKVSCNILTDSMVYSESIDGKDVIVINVLAMVEYGERAGSGLQGIFKTWEAVYHCSPNLEITTLSGIDRTTLSLNFEGHQPDIEAMKQLYSGMIETGEETESTQESTQEISNSKGESNSHTKKSNGEIILSKGESKNNVKGSKGETTRSKVINLLSENGKLTLPEIADTLGFSLGGIEKIVRQLKAEGILSREGSTKAGKWIVNSNV